MMKTTMSSANVTTIFLWSLLIATMNNCLPFCYAYGGCIQSEREDLLKLKQDFTDPSNRLASWVGEEDCCSWFGVVCDNSTGHVLELHLRTLSIQEYFGYSPFYGLEAVEYEEKYHVKSAFGGKINPSLLNLKNLRYLDLSYNNFGGIQIPTFFGSMQSLNYLNLSWAGFGGMIPPQLGNLSNLQYLNLQGDLHVENLDWLFGLSSLEFLDLSTVDINQDSDWLNVINSLPSLVELHLSGCRLAQFPLFLSVNISSLAILDLSYNNFQGPIPDSLQNMTSSIRELNLKDCFFNSSIPNWLYGLDHLEVLNLGTNDLQGPITSVLGNMTALTILDMSYNQELEFEGGIPTSFKNFCNLESFYMSGVKLNQQTNDVLEILSGCVSDGLRSLSLDYCQLSGHLTDDLGNFKNMVSFDLSSNSISGPIPSSLGELVSLKLLKLSFNKLNGTLPLEFGQLINLERVYISDNVLEGVVSEVHFANITNLLTLYSSGNKLQLRVGPDWIPPLGLGFLGLRSWYIGSEFPAWLRSLKHLEYLDLSQSGISSTIPLWFWDLRSNMYYLNFSQNQIHGFLPDLLDVPIDYSFIDLSSNNFSGPLPRISANVSALDLSNNSFSGTMSDFLCYRVQEVKNMRVLNLRQNLLSGEIPDCWSDWKYLIAIKLNDNRLSGNIPMSIGNLDVLQSLHLRNNDLIGEIPWSLKNCKSLITLDFGVNKLEGNIPIWLGESLSSLVILDLHANKFYGHIPQELCRLTSLQILELSDNCLSGNIPSCVNNFSSMAAKGDADESQIHFDAVRGSFLEDAFLVMKGKVMEYSTILQFVRSMDLSNNKLLGKIPEEITSLTGLQSLNLSLNLFSGRIPKDIGVMGSLESIDLSQNQLIGEIPESLTRLSFLSHLNLSFNNLSGRIPLGTQLQSFDLSSFLGNQHLCGPPVSKNCSVDGATPSVGNGGGKGDGGFDMEGLYVSMAIGFVVSFWCVVGPLVFNGRWRDAYFSFLDRLGLKS